MRAIFERVIETSDAKAGKTGGELVRGTCLYACVLLQSSLERFAGCKTQVRGGDGLEDGAVIDPGGRRRGHYWLEGTTESGERFLADITADQFGLPPVTILWAEDSWEEYQAGDDVLVARHVAEVQADLAAAARDSENAVGPQNTGGELGTLPGTPGG